MVKDLCVLIVLLFVFAVESESHCDFTKLREMLIRTNMEDMREVTHSNHYELYRKKMLEQVRLLLFRWTKLFFSSFFGT